MDTSVEHHPERHSFTASVEGTQSHLDYKLGAGVMTILHTEVDPAVGGRGIGGALVRAALDHAASAGLKVQPTCSYARAYMDRHPETAALRA